MRRVDYDDRQHRTYGRGRALSTFEYLTEKEMRDGLEKMRHAADVESEPRPVTEEIDLLVLRRD